MVEIQLRSKLQHVWATGVETVGAFCGVADGFIVGTAFKQDGRVSEPVEVDRVRAFVERVREG